MGGHDLLISKIKPNRDKALMLVKRAVGVLVHDSILLEGVDYTLPEVLTLLEGVTVGGHELSDQQIAINQGNAWRYLFVAVKAGEFTFSLAFLFGLHAIAGKEEALEWGCFRSGGVTIAGSSYLPPKADALNRKFSELLVSMNAFDDIYDKAIHVFLLMARNQFFYDVNKRTGRLMMNGILLNAGYPPLNLSAKYKLKFNELMMRFYDSGDESEMNLFLRSCIDPKFVEIMSE